MSVHSFPPSVFSVLIFCSFLCNEQGVGLNLDDALAFWRAEFSKKVSSIVVHDLFFFFLHDLYQKLKFTYSFIL